MKNQIITKIFYLTFYFIFVIGANNFIFSSSLFAKIIVFKDFKLPDDTKIPFGEVILFKGDLKPGIKEVKLVFITNFGEEEKTASIRDSSWTVISGPFDVNQEIFFRFKVVSQRTNKELQQIEDSLDVILNNVVDKMLSTSIDMDTTEFKNFTEGKLRDTLPEYLKKIKSSDNRYLYDIIIKEMVSLNIDEQLDLFNDIRSLKESNDEIKVNVEFIEVNSNQITLINKAKNSPDSIATNTEIREVLSKVIDSVITDSTKKSTLINYLDDISKLQDSINTYTESIDNFKNEIINNILLKVSTFESTEILETIAEVRDIESYAGFDIALIGVPRIGILESYFTINSYLKKVEYDTDSKYIFDNFSISGGICLNKPNNISSDGSLYYIGLGYRMNKFFRFTLGTSFYKKEDESRFVFETASGFSINFRQIGEILKIFNGVSSSITGL